MGGRLLYANAIRQGTVEVPSINTSSNPREAGFALYVDEELVGSAF